MRTIESRSYESDGAKLKLLLVESGKVLPFRVCSHHFPPNGKEKHGTLAAVADEEEGRNQFEFACKQADDQGWSPALRGVTLLPGVPPPPSGVPTSPSAAAPEKRKPGRPRKNAKS